MASKLEIYNMALGHIGERKISSLTEAREPRRALDDFYDAVVAGCLEEGFWNWSMRTIEQAASESYDPEFGLTYAFEKPTDWVRTYLISTSERMDPPLLEYVDEGGLWYADVDPLYIKFVSNGTTYGLDLSLWSQRFADYVAASLAVKSCKRVTGSFDETLLKIEDKARRKAKSKDAMDEPPGFAPTGTWVRSRGASADRRRWNGQTT